MLRSKLKLLRTRMKGRNSIGKESAPSDTEPRQISGVVNVSPISAALVSDVVQQELRQCSHCDRKFSVDIVMKHEAICQNVRKNRNKFDSLKHRLAGLSAGAVVPTNNKSSSVIVPRRSSWRDKSDQLRAAIAVSRTTDVDERYKLEAELSRVTKSALIKCEFCSRSFNDEVAKRHIPFCRTKANMMPRVAHNRIEHKLVYKGEQPGAHIAKGPPIRIRNAENRSLSSIPLDSKQKMARSPAPTLRNATQKLYMQMRF